MFFCTIVSIRGPEALKRITLGVAMCAWERVRALLLSRALMMIIIMGELLMRQRITENK